MFSYHVSGFRQFSRIWHWTQLRWVIVLERKCVSSTLVSPEQNSAVLPCHGNQVCAGGSPLQREDEPVGQLDHRRTHRGLQPARAHPLWQLHKFHRAQRGEMRIEVKMILQTLIPTYSYQTLGHRSRCEVTGASLPRSWCCSSLLSCRRSQPG